MSFWKFGRNYLILIWVLSFFFNSDIYLFMKLKSVIAWLGERGWCGRWSERNKYLLIFYCVIYEWFNMIQLWNFGVINWLSNYISLNEFLHVTRMNQLLLFINYNQKLYISDLKFPKNNIEIESAHAFAFNRNINHCSHHYCWTVIQLLF